MHNYRRALCEDCPKGDKLGPEGCYKCQVLDGLVQTPSHCLYYAGKRTPVDVVIITATRIEFDTVLKDLHPGGERAWKPECLAEDGNWYLSTYDSPINPDASVRLALTLASTQGLP